jgi:uncharacterized Tic20 family protein
MNEVGNDPMDPEKRDDPVSSPPSEIESSLPASPSESEPAQPPLLPAASGESNTDASTVLSQEERNWAAALHGSGGIGLLCYFSSIPFLNIVVPLIIWIMKREEMPFVKSQGKEVLNFHISWTLYALAITLVVGAIGLVLTFVIVGIFILWGLAIMGGVYLVAMAALSIIGTVNAADGKPHRYPLTIRFIK